jgi:hypothetical protein
MQRRGKFSPAVVFLGLVFSLVAGAEDRTFDYKILATTKTSTMEKELNEAAAEGYVFSQVMGGQTGVGGKEVVVAMVKDLSAPGQRIRNYKLLATNKTSTMQKEMQAMADEGFDYVGQSVFQSAFGGNEVVIIMERDTSKKDHRSTYLLLATTRTSTMDKELKQAGEQGYALVGLTVGKTALGGSEVVCVLRKD